jgi:hypothetical protein
MLLYANSIPLLLEYINIYILLFIIHFIFLFIALYLLYLMHKTYSIFTSIQIKTIADIKKFIFNRNNILLLFRSGSLILYSFSAVPLEIITLADALDDGLDVPIYSGMTRLSESPDSGYFADDETMFNINRNISDSDNEQADCPATVYSGPVQDFLTDKNNINNLVQTRQTRQLTFVEKASFKCIMNTDSRTLSPAQLLELFESQTSLDAAIYI